MNALFENLNSYVRKLEQQALNENTYLVEKQLATYETEIKEAEKNRDLTALEDLLNQVNKEPVNKISYKGKKQLTDEIKNAIDSVSKKLQAIQSQEAERNRIHNMFTADDAEMAERKEEARLRRELKKKAAKKVQDEVNGSASESMLVNSGVVIENGQEIRLKLRSTDWNKLADIADEYYAGLRERNFGEEWAVSDGEHIFANASTAIKYYIDHYNNTDELDPKKRTDESKKGNILYKYCEMNTKHQEKASDNWMFSYWRYATGDEIRNALNANRIEG